MARALRIQFPGAFYHITCRGIEHRDIYINNQDRNKFLTFLNNSLEIYQVQLYAFILMDNHFHLIIKTKKANCSEFMRHFNICYTTWFNWRHHRNGNLYQGRYKAFLIDANNYLIEVSRYLHLNCVRVNRLKSLDYQKQWEYVSSYHWSSIGGYLNETKMLKYIDYSLILSMVGGRRQYRKYLQDGLKKEIENPFEKAKNREILGNDNFVRRVKKFIRNGSLREQPSYRDINTLKPETVINLIKKEFDVDVRTLKRSNSNGLIRGITAELLYRFSNITQSQIGKILGNIDYGAVYLLRRRFKEKMTKNPNLKNRFQKIEAQLKNM